MSYPGPPPVKPHTGAKILAAKDPIYSVPLDAGAFRAAWEVIEARQRANPSTQGEHALARARDSFRAAFWGQYETEESTKKRRVVRRARK